MSLGRSVIIAKNVLRNFCAFLEKRPLTRKIFPILLRQFSPPQRSTLLCSNFVTFCRREIGEIVRFLPDEKNSADSLKLSLLGYCAYRAQNLPGPAPNNILSMLQISSISAELERNAWRPSFPARRYASSGISRRHVSVCLCLCVTRRYCIKTAKCRITQTTLLDSP